MSILMRKDMCRGRVVLPDEKIVLAEKNLAENCLTRCFSCDIVIKVVLTMPKTVGAKAQCADA